MAHFALQKLNIRPGVLLGICSSYEPMEQRERAFTYASIIVRIEKEKEESRKVKR